MDNAVRERPRVTKMAEEICDSMVDLENAIMQIRHRIGSINPVPDHPTTGLKSPSMVDETSLVTLLTRMDARLNSARRNVEAILSEL